MKESANSALDPALSQKEGRWRYGCLLSIYLVVTAPLALLAYLANRSRK